MVWCIGIRVHPRPHLRFPSKSLRLCVSAFHLNLLHARRAAFLQFIESGNKPAPPPPVAGLRLLKITYRIRSLHE
jgi:hypothetical protein